MSVLVPVLNEERNVRTTVAAMQAQRFDGTIELLFADGGSEDRTREVLLELAAEDPRIRVFENPRRGTASGLNVCLREARGEFVARMDAHTLYSDRYLAAGRERLLRGDTEWVSGPSVPSPGGAVSRSVALALAGWLGSGGSGKFSASAAEAQERELDTGVFCGMWRRAMVLEVGGWDERWPINQDSEMASRFLERGARLISIPEMAGRYMPRDSLRGLGRQYFRYGMYRARTFRRHPRSMRAVHLFPPALAGAAVGAFVPARGPRRASRVALGAYLAAVAANSARPPSPDAGAAERALLFVVLPVMHLAWGFGTLVGVARFGPPLAALGRLVGWPVATRGAGDAEQVFAPSLYDRRT